MGTTAQKLLYLSGSKTAVKSAINARGVSTTGIPFGDYGTLIRFIAPQTAAEDAQAIASGYHWRVGAVGSGSYYQTFANAISNATDGDTITLLDDINEIIAVPDDRIVTIDGGWHSISASGNTVLTLHQYSVVTLKNIRIANTSGGTAVITANGTCSLTLDSGTIIENDALTAENGATTNLTNGSRNGIRSIDGEAYIRVNDGAVIVCGGGAIVIDSAAGASGGAEVNINGGTIVTGFYFMLSQRFHKGEQHQFT